MVTVLSEILSVTPILVTLIVFYVILGSFIKSCKNITNLDKILLYVLIQKWTILFRTKLLYLEHVIVLKVIQRYNVINFLR